MAQDNTEPRHPWFRPTLHATHINLDGAEQRLLTNGSFDGVVAAGNVSPGMTSWTSKFNRILDSAILYLRR